MADNEITHVHEPETQDETSGAGRSARSAKSKTKTASASVEKRKLRNRLSQQAFRARQHLEINELKQRLGQFQGSESDRNHRLANENQTLRKQLWQCEKKLRSLQATLKDVVDSIVEIKERDFTDQSDSTFPSLQSADEDSASSSSMPYSWNDQQPNGNCSTGHEEVIELPIDDVTLPAAHDLVIGATTTVSSMIPWTILHLPQQNFITSADAFSPNDPHLDSYLPAVSSAAHTTTGAPSLTQISLVSERIFPLHTKPQLSVAHSKYCQHIDAFEMCIMTNYLLDKSELDMNSLTRAISAVVSAFVKVAWSGMESWMRYTNGCDTLTKMTAWRMAPSLATFTAIPQCLRPTQLQVAVPHPAVIDWCVFPFLRDQLIQHHSADPALDDICGDVGLAYVVQADLADLVQGAQSLTVNLSVHEILHGMENSPESVSPDDYVGFNSEVKLPAPNMRSLLHTKGYAWELFRHLKLAQGGDVYRVAPDLFDKYPHLYKPDVAIAVGVPLRSFSKISWPTPRPLDDMAMECYRNYASLSAGRAAEHQLSKA